MSTDVWTPNGNVEPRELSVPVELGLPPNYVEICAALGTPPETVVFAWGDRVYSPRGGKLSPDLQVHESVHFEQQAEVGGPEWWWTKYLNDPVFRLEQEVEAYRAQMAWFPTREERRAARRKFAKDLAGPIYALPLTWQQADNFLQGRGYAMAASLRSRS